MVAVEERTVTSFGDTVDVACILAEVLSRAVVCSFADQRMSRLKEIAANLV